MTNIERNASAWLAATVTAVVAAFTADLLAPTAISVHIFYVVPILLTWFMPTHRSTLVTTGVVSVLTLMGLLGRPPGELDPAVVGDHFLAVILFAPVAALVLGAKITRARRAAAEKALWISEQRFRHLFEYAATGIAVTDLAQRFEECNGAYRSLLGYGEEDLRRMKCSSLVHPDDLEANELNVRRLVAGEVSSFEMENRLIRRDGQAVWVRRSVSIFPEESSRPAHLVTLVTDVTEHRRMVQVLRENESRLRLALDASKAGVWEWDLRTGQASWDDRFHAMCGLSASVPRGYPVWAERLHPDDRARVHRRIEEVRRTPGDDDWREEFRMVRPDGTVVWLYGLGRSVRDVEGRVTHMIGLALDITEQKRVEEALRQVGQELERRVDERTVELDRQARQLRRLASDLTLAEQRARADLARTLHDGVQQLLFGARLQLDRLARGAEKGNQPRAEALQRAAAGLDDAIAATRALSVEMSPPVLREAGLAAALEWLADWMRERHGLNVALSLNPAANPDGQDVRILVFESVRELLFNVVKHSSVLEAELELAPCGQEQFRVTVADHGAGMDMTALAPPRHAPGSGLGLFTIRERVALLGGRFDIEAAPGKGTRFTLVAGRHAGGASRTLDMDSLVGAAAAAPVAVASGEPEEQATLLDAVAAEAGPA